MNDAQEINADNNWQALMTEFQALSSFAEVKDWSKRAEREIARITGIVRGLDLEIARGTQALERLKYEQSKKGLGRLFGGVSSEEKELNQRLKQYQHTKSELKQTAQQLQESIDFTPNSPDERKALIAELRQHKRELQGNKREITSVIHKPLRAQPQGTQGSMVFNNAALERRKARYAREVALLSQEKTGASINRQLAQVDRDILWVEKFNQ